MRTRFLPVWFLAVALMGVGLWQGTHDAAQAATTYYATNNNDSGVGSLRAAVLSATDGDNVHVVTPGPIALNSTIAITHSVTIEGPEIAVDPSNPGGGVLSGQVTIQGSNGSVFSVSSGKTVAMSHLYITGGTASGTTFPAGNGDPAYGGGIYNAGNLTLNYCSINDNEALAGNGATSGGIAYGGGIYSSGTLTLNQSTVDGNSAVGGAGANNASLGNIAYGGGIYSTGTTNINSSTISNNEAVGGGTSGIYSSVNGGFGFGGGLAQTSGTLNLTNATIAANTAEGGNGTSVNGDTFGGGVAVKNAVLNPLNTTIADNNMSGAGTANGSGLYYNGAAPLTINNSIVAGNNGGTDLSGPANQNGSYVNGAFAVTLTDNGGPTETIATADPNVVNAGDNTYSSSLPLDQRGAMRLHNGVVDAGAVENGSSLPVYNGATVLDPFTFQIVNGKYNFTAADFTSSLTYPDPGASLQSIVIVSVPTPAHGYIELNGQILSAGSIISVNDLNQLTWVSNDGSEFGQLQWQASDGNTLSGTITSQTPTWSSAIDGVPAGYGGGNPGNGTSSPILNVSTPVHVGGNTYTIDAFASSSAVSGLSTKVTVTATGSGVVSVSPSTQTTAAPGPAFETSTITLNASSPGTHVVTITARDINSNATSYQLVFDTNAAGDVQGVSGDYGGINGNGSSSPTLSVSNFPQNVVPDGAYTVYASVSSNAKLGTGTASQVNVSVVGQDGTTVSPSSNPTYSNSSGAASGTANITLNVTSGLHYVTVIATDINGRSTSYHFSYLGDAVPAFTNKGSITSPSHVQLGSQYTQEFDASDADYYVPSIPSIKPEPLRFQVDQVCYGTSGNTCDSSNTESNIGSFGATNLTGNLNSGTTLNTNFNWTPTKPGTYGLKVTLTDYWHLGDTFVYTVIVDAPPAPIITNPGTQVAQINEPFNLNMGSYVTDSYSGAILTYSATGLPSWASFNPATGAITGTASALGTNSVKVTVQDQFGSSASTTFDLTVINGAPVVTDPTEGQTIYAPIGQSFIHPVVATDPNGETITYSASGLPAWATINTSTGIISSIADPLAGDVGSSAVTLDVSDGTNTTTVHFTLTVTNGNPPVLNETGVYALSSPYNISVGANFSHQFQATDVDPSDTLTFTATEGTFTVGAYSGTPGTTQDVTYDLTGVSAGTHNITVTVTDSTGNTDTATFTIVAGVGSAPTLTVSPSGPYNAVTGSTIPTITATAKDADPNETLTFSLGSGAPSGMTLSQTSFTNVAANTPVQTVLQWTPTSSQAGSYTFNIVVQDSSGFQTTVPITINVTLSAVNHVPTIQNPGTQTATTDTAFSVQIVANDPDGDALSYSATGLPGWAAISDTTGIISGTPGPGDVGTDSVTVSVTDNVNAPVSATFELKVTGPNLPPVVTNPGTQTASVGSFFTVSIPASDPNGDTLTWTGVSLPTWATLNSANGILSGTPSGADVGTVVVTVEVSDGVNSPVPVTFQIVVSGFGTPTLTATPFGLGNPEQVILGEGYSKIFVSHDSDYPETLTFNAVVTQIAGSGGNVGDAGLTTMFESGDASNGTTAATKFDWTPDTAGTYKVVMSVTDGDGNTTSQTFSINVSSPPTIHVNPTTLSATPEMPLTIPVAVSDADDHETLTVSTEFGAPFSMTFDGASTFSNVPGNTTKYAVLTYTPGTFEANSNYVFNVTVTDSAGLTATQTITINVGAVNERPIISSPTAGSNNNVVVGHNINLAVVATDAENDTLTYSATGLPFGLTIDSSTGVISGTVSGSGSSTVTVTVDDGNHVSPAASVTFKIVISTTNHAPTLDPIADQTITIGQALNIQAVGSDLDNDVLTYTQTGLPGSWATFDNATGIIGGTPGSGDEGSWNVTVTVDDGYSGTTSQSFTLTVTGPFSTTVTSGSGYETITYTVSNTTGNTISPVVRGSLTGSGYLDNENAFFNASQGFVDDQWASPVLQRKIDPTKNTRILTWTVGDLAPGASATLSISVPIKGNTPHGTQLTNTWSVDYGSTHQTISPVTHP